jgi:hypothetical protein
MPMKAHVHLDEVTTDECLGGTVYSGVWPALSQRPGAHEQSREVADEGGGAGNALGSLGSPTMGTRSDSGDPRYASFQLGSLGMGLGVFSRRDYGGGSEAQNPPVAPLKMHVLALALILKRVMLIFGNRMCHKQRSQTTMFSLHKLSPGVLG